MSKRITLQDIQNLRMSSDDSDDESRNQSRQQSVEVAAHVKHADPTPPVPTLQTPVPPLFERPPAAEDPAPRSAAGDVTAADAAPLSHSFVPTPTTAMAVTPPLGSRVAISSPQTTPGPSSPRPLSQLGVASSQQNTPGPSPRPLSQTLKSSARSGDSDSDSSSDSPDFNSTTVGGDNHLPLSGRHEADGAGEGERIVVPPLNGGIANQSSSPHTILPQQQRGDAERPLTDRSTVRAVAPLSPTEVLDPLGGTLNEGSTRRSQHLAPCSPTSLNGSVVSRSSSSFKLSELSDRDVDGRPTLPYTDPSPPRTHASPTRQQVTSKRLSGRRSTSAAAASNSPQEKASHDRASSSVRRAQVRGDTAADTTAVQPGEMLSLEMLEGFYNPIKSKYGLTARDLMHRRDLLAAKKIRFNSNVPTSLEERREAVAAFVRGMMMTNQQTVHEIEEREQSRIQQREEEIAARNPPMRFKSGPALTAEEKHHIAECAKKDFEREWSIFKSQPSRLQIIEEQQQQAKEGQLGPMRFVSQTEEDRKRNAELALLAADELDRRKQERELVDKTEGFINRFQRSTTASRFAAEASFRELEEKTNELEKAETLRAKPAAEVLTSNNEDSVGAPARLHARLTATERRRRQLLAEEAQRKIDEEEARKKKLAKIPCYKPMVSSRLLQPTASIRQKEADLMVERRANMERSLHRAVASRSARGSEYGGGGDNASSIGDAEEIAAMSPSARVLNRNFSRNVTDIVNSLSSPLSHNPNRVNDMRSPHQRNAFSRGMTNVSSTTESHGGGGGGISSPSGHHAHGDDRGTPLGLPETALARARREVNVKKRDELEAKDREEQMRRVSRPFESSQASVVGLVGGAARPLRYA